MTIKEIKKEIAAFLELEMVRRDRMKKWLKEFERDFDTWHEELLSYYDQHEITKELYYTSQKGFYTEKETITDMTGKDFWISINILIEYLKTIPEQLKEKTKFRENLIKKTSE